jgi:hypothetical protein
MMIFCMASSGVQPAIFIGIEGKKDGEFNPVPAARPGSMGPIQLKINHPASALASPVVTKTTPRTISLSHLCFIGLTLTHPH